MGASRLLDWERTAIVGAYIDGEKTEAIAAEFGVKTCYVPILARRMGVPARPWGRPRKNLQFPKPVLALQT